MAMSEDKYNLNYIKKKLQSYQLSTVTSGLNGDDRYEELKYRLESYEKQLDGSQRVSSGSNSSSRVDDSNVEGSSFQVPSLNSLSIGEVRARLAVMGENTNTPGLTGEERRNALVKRLIDATYSKTDDSVLEVLISTNNSNNTDASSSKIYNDYSDGARRNDISLINNVPVDYNHSEVMNSQNTTPISSLPSAHSSLASVISSSSAASASASSPPTKVDIPSLKKELKRISNQRALLIASKLSGSNQDVDLKLSELRLVKVDHELNTWRNYAAATKTQRGDKKKVDLKKFKSDFVKLSHDVDQVLLVEDLILELEEHKKGVKEEIRAHRSRIKSEVEQHAEFGVDQEQAITKLLKEINLQKTSHKGGTNVQKPSIGTEVNLQRPFIMDGASVQRPSVVSGIDVQRPSSLVGRTKQKIQEIISSAKGTANNDIDGNDGDRDFNDGKDKKYNDMNINATSTSTIVTSTTILTKESDLSTPGLILKSSFIGGTIDLNLKDNIKSNVDATLKATKAMAVATSSSVSMSSKEKYSRHHQYEYDDERYDDDDDHDESDSDDDRYDRKSDDAKDMLNPLNADKGEDNRGTVIDSDDHDKAVNAYVFYSSNSSSSSVVSRQPPTMKITSSTINNTKNSGMITDDDNNNNDDHDYDENNYNVDDNYYHDNVDDNYNHDNDDKNDDVNDTTTNDGEKEKYRIDIVENESIEAKGTKRNNDNDDNSSGINNRHGKNGDNDDSDDDKVDAYDDDDDKNDNSNDHKADKVFQDFYSDEDHTDYVDHDDSDNNDNNNHDDNDDHNHDDNEDHVDRSPDNNEDHDDVDFEHKQIKLLLHQAKQLSSCSGIDEADSLYQQALELDPMNISTLVSYASFLHKKKGELARAEAFYNRCLQVYLPGVVLKKADDMHALVVRDDSIVDTHNDRVDDVSNLNAVSVSQLSLEEDVRDNNDDEANHNHSDYHPTESTMTIFNDNPSTVENSINTLVPLNKTRDNPHPHHHGISTKSDNSSSSSPIEMKKRFKLRHVINFLLSYANFMNKSKGDIESSILLYQKGIELSPSDGHLLATYAHFLSSIGQSIYNQRANIYFQKALKLLPGNPQYTLWYAKLLKKMGQLNKAELMYRVSLEQSKMMDDIEPIAICNYATFLFKIRKDVIQAKALFEEGLSTYPNHKGLKKNYRCLVK